MKPPSTARTAGRSDWAERRFRRQPFILLSFSSSKKPRKAQETQSYQRFQHIVHTDFNTSGTNGPRSLSRAKVGTHSAFGEESHITAHRAKHGAFRTGGWYHYPRSVPHVRKPPRAGYQNGVLCRFWVLAGCALEERRKPSGQRCAYACRCPEGVAAPLGCVIFFAFVEIGICTSGAHGFPRVRGMGGITTLGVLCVLLKRRTAACQSGSFAIFRGQVVIIDSSGAKCVPLFTKTAAVHSKQLRFPVKGTGGCFCVTSCSDTGRSRSGRGCRRSWGRNDRRQHRR